MANQVIKLDELTHNGVKGMKWDESKKKSESKRSPAGKIKGDRLKKEKGFVIKREDIGPGTPFGQNINKLSPKSQTEIDAMTANEYVDYLNTHKIERTDETEGVWKQKRKNEKVKHSSSDVDKFLTHYNEETYAYPMPLNPVIEADKSKSISEMTLDELRRLIGRLRDEREAEDIIRSLRRSAGQKDTFENPAKIDTKTPVDQLYHEGIPGMKWGIRRFQRKDGTRTPLGKARDESEDYTKSRESGSKGSASLSNDELKKLNERLQLEATYKALTTAKIEKAESFVGDALKKAGSQALTTFASGIMLGVAKSLVKEISPSLAEAAGFGVKTAVAAVVAAPATPAAPKPPKVKK